MTTTKTPTVSIRKRMSGQPFFVEAIGPAMVGGLIEEGNLLLVEPDKPVTDGSTVLVDSAIGRFVAKVRHVDGNIHLTPICPDLKPTVLRGQSTSRLSTRLYRIEYVSKAC
ncbi:MAG TPA: S24 family peptidase [Nitrospira sp.]